MKFSATIHENNYLPGVVALNREVKANPFMPDSPFKPTITDVFRWQLVDRQNKVPLNPKGYGKTFCEAVKHFERQGDFRTISRGNC